MTIKNLLEKNANIFHSAILKSIDINGNNKRLVNLRLKDFCTPKEEEKYTEDELINLYQKDLFDKMKKYIIKEFGQYWVNRFEFIFENKSDIKLYIVY